jgi:hypothetical protein
MLSLLVLPEWMPEWLPYVGAVLVFVAIFLAIQGVIARKRTEALTAVAPQIGFYFQGKDWNGPQAAPQLVSPLFQRGRSKEFRNIMTGSAAGLRTALFDYSFTVGYGRSQRTYKQTIGAYSKDRMLLPLFTLQPKGIWQKLTNAIVRKDVAFESHPEFSRRYQLRCPDTVAVQALFTPQLLAFLESLDQKKKWRLEGSSDSLLIYRIGKLAKPPEMRAFLEETSTIATSFFSYCGATSGAAVLRS